MDTTNPVDAIIAGIDPDRLDVDSVKAARDFCNEEVDVPDRSPWIICPECNGDGKHSRHLGSFSREDIERDWDPDSWQDYLDGAYDQQCDVCRGTGKVRQQTYDTLSEARAEYRSESHHHFDRGY